MTPGSGWSPPPARPTIEPGSLAVWLLAGDVESPLETVAARYLDVAVEDVVIVRTVEGKPAVEGATLEVNLAHSGSVALVAVAIQAVGIDVEQLREDISGWALPAHALTPAERARVDVAQDPARAFLELWAQKEALVKAAGLGLTIEPNTIELGDDDEIVSLPPALGPPSDWTVKSIPLYGYGAAVAVRGVLTRLELYDARATV